MIIEKFKRIKAKYVEQCQTCIKLSINTAYAYSWAFVGKEWELLVSLPIFSCTELLILLYNSQGLSSIFFVSA